MIISKSSAVNLSYQPVIPRIWFDHKVRNMPLLPKLTYNILITCGEAVASSRTGIYEIDREDIRSLIHTIDGLEPCPSELAFDLMGWHEHELKRFLKKDELDENDLQRCKGYFNREKPDLLEYDVKNHCIHVKSLFKYAIRSGLLRTVKSQVKAIQHAIEIFEEKCPLFLADFAKKYFKDLKKLEHKMAQDPSINEYVAARDALRYLFMLVESKSALSANPKLVSPEKIEQLAQELKKISR